MTTDDNEAGHCSDKQMMAIFSDRGNMIRGGDLMGSISEKELKLLMNFIKDNLQEARDTDNEELRKERLEKTLEHIQQYLED
ncbi:MAG: hypothetical protein J6P45_01185 [Lachnospiraceae bacterium]|nr:hypothetical protein [Lachnospiraceae bacterium]